MMDEQSYRHLVDQTFNRIDAAFGEVDPDQAESSLSQGALTVTFPGGVKCILSPQPAVRQVWVAFRDRAWHLDWHMDKQRWFDDRGEGLDLHALVKRIAHEAGKVEVDLP